MPHACATVCACKRRCALQGLQRRCSWEFERHAARQRNGIGLRADTPATEMRIFKFHQERSTTLDMHASVLLKALAHPDGLFLPCRLSQGEQCVSELENLLGILQSTLSRQLGVLREERLASTRRKGKQIFYSIASKEALAVMHVLYQQFCAPEKGKK